jgi:predicted permease
MREPWTTRLARALPHATARDLFEPSVHDARAQFVRAAAHAGRVKRGALRVSLAITVVVLYFDCLRLAILRKDLLTMFLRDVRHALRLFRREPVFSCAAVLTLALGIGMNAALFAVVEAVLLRPLPLLAEEIVMLRHRDVRTGITKDFAAMGDVIDLAARQKSLEVLAAFSGTQGILVGEGDPVRLAGIAATPELFQALAVQPLLGRFFERDDVREGSPNVVIISHDLWSTRFGSNPHIAGRSIQIGTARRLIVGVLPPGFRFPAGARTDMIVPMRLPSAAPAERRAWIHAMGRLAPGVTVEQATTEFTVLSEQLEREFPASNLGTQYYVLDARDAMVGDTKRPLLLLLVAVAFVLLIACANVGNLLLARSLARQQETAMRMALGAGRGRLIAQFLTEGLVLALAGGIVGVAVAWRAAPALARLVPQATPIAGLDDVSLNVTVVLYAFAAALAAALVSSGAASIGLTGSSSAVVAMRRTTVGKGARRAASALVAAEVALAVVLLIGASLTLRSFANLIAVDPGFSPRNVLSLRISVPPGRYPDAEARRAFFDRAFAALDALPEVEAVGAAVVVPLTGNNWTVPFERSDQPIARGERAPDVGWQSASGGYFATLEIPLRAGRLFEARDRPGSPPVVIVSEGIAARFFPGETPVGRRVRLGQTEAEIVGVVGDIRRAALSDEPRQDMYFPFERAPDTSNTIFIRTASDPLQTLAAVRTTLRTVERDIVVFDARTMDDYAAESAAITQLAMRLLAGFAIVALLLAAIGIYGVMSYVVARRMRELGTRLALGATRGAILAMVLKESAAISGTGLAAGLVIGLVASRSLKAILYGVPPWDPVAITAATVLLAASAVAASYLPARRAARIDPARTLAAE